MSVYDPQGDRWSEGPSLPRGVRDAMLVMWRGEVVVLGGFTDSAGRTPSSEGFVLRNGRWRAFPSMPDPRAAAGAAVAVGRIVVVGGVGPAAERTFVFDGEGWRTASPLPRGPLQRPAVGADPSWLYVAGGADASGAPTERAHRYDPIEDRWQSLPSMPVARAAAAAAWVAGRVIVAGGSTAAGVTGRVDAFDVPSGRWLQLPAMRRARAGAVAGAVGNEVYIFGGRAGRRVVAALERLTVTAPSIAF